MFATVASPAAAKGTTWWNSRNPRSPQTPREPTKAQRPPSRCQTARFTLAGKCRDVVAAASGEGIPGLGEFLSSPILEQQGQGTVEDYGWIALQGGKVFVGPRDHEVQGAASVDSCRARIAMDHTREPREVPRCTRECEAARGEPQERQ